MSEPTQEKPAYAPGWNPGPLNWFPNDQVTWIVADSLETLTRILETYRRLKIDQANIVGKTAQERRP